jgi:putative hydroxymethylpyrimidine transport system ATP-binding protein
MPAQGCGYLHARILSIPQSSGIYPYRRNRSMLRVSSLSKRFGDLSIFENFNLELPARGFTVLIGPSGCGKSTLFNVLTGVVTRDGGKVSWCGKAVEYLKDTSAYMQQKDLLLPWFTLMDNALLPAMIAGENITEAAKKAQSLFRQLGLEGFESYLPGEISGGMRQRCALVRTLMFERELVFLDEPLSALDAITRRSLQALLLMLQVEFEKSLLMITHDVEEALALADEVLVLSGRPMRVLDRFSLDGPKLRRLDDPELIRIKESVLSLLQEELEK